VLIRNDNDSKPRGRRKRPASELTSEELAVQTQQHNCYIARKSKPDPAVRGRPKKKLSTPKELERQKRKSDYDAARRLNLRKRQAAQAVGDSQPSTSNSAIQVPETGSSAGGSSSQAQVGTGNRASGSGPRPGTTAWLLGLDSSQKPR